MPKEDKRFFTQAGRDALKAFRAENPGADPSLSSGRRSPRALRSATAAAGAKRELPASLVGRAKKGEFAKPRKKK